MQFDFNKFLSLSLLSPQIQNALSPRAFKNHKKSKISKFKETDQLTPGESFKEGTYQISLS